MQNAASLEAQNIEKLELKAYMIEDLNASHAKELEELNFSDFVLFIIILKIINSIYANQIILSNVETWKAMQAICKESFWICT